MRFLLDLAWRDLRATGRSLWVFVACLVLGVSLVTAGGGLYRQTSDALLGDARALFGGDVEVQSPEPLTPDVLQWMSARGEVSRLVELRTMMRLSSGRSHLIELQSADARYPLYGDVLLQPRQSLETATRSMDGHWGMAVDAALAQRMSINPGDWVEVGDLRLQVRALIERQPDRSLRADWGAAPVLVADGALVATGLMQPLSRVDYRYRVRTPQAPGPWRESFVRAFPRLDAEARSFEQRSDRMAEVLGQIGSGLMLIGFSALFIGGMGVFNSVGAYLQAKRPTLATLRAIGLRDRRLAAFVLWQVLVLAALASLGGVLLGNALALAGSLMAAQRLPMALSLSSLWGPSVWAWVFGLLTALTFAWPALTRALSVSPGALLRGAQQQTEPPPLRARVGTTLWGVLGLALLLLALPDPLFGLYFVVAIGTMLAVLDGVVRLLRRAANRWMLSGWVLYGRLKLPLAAQLAVAGLRQPSSPLRVALLSLGSALTLLVACTLVVATLLRAVNETVPARAPALVFYDVQPEQIEPVRDLLRSAPTFDRFQVAPLVLGRLTHVNGEDLRESVDAGRALESRDEHKLSSRQGNIDDVVLVRGAWWPADHQGPPLVAMEDREADELGVNVGDVLAFEILGQSVQARLVAIYSQRRLQARLWLEAIFSDGVLDPHITRYVGAAYLDPEDALAMQDRIAALAPNIATVRTESLLSETRALMARASGALVLVAGVCLAASLLVLASVVAASRNRQIHDATVMHAVGARLSTLRQVLVWEYLLLAVVTTGFSTLAGSALGYALLGWRLDLDPAGMYWSGALTASAVSASSLFLAARYLLGRLRLNAAMLLRQGG